MDAEHTDIYEYNPLPGIPDDERCSVPECPYRRCTGDLCVHHYRPPMTQDWIDAHATPGGPEYGKPARGRQLLTEISTA